MGVGIVCCVLLDILSEHGFALLCYLYLPASAHMLLSVIVRCHAGGRRCFQEKLPEDIGKHRHCIQDMCTQSGEKISWK